MDLSVHFKTETFGIGPVERRQICSVSNGNSVNCVTFNNLSVHSSGTHTESRYHVSPQPSCTCIEDSDVILRKVFEDIPQIQTCLVIHLNPVLLSSTLDLEDQVKSTGGIAKHSDLVVSSTCLNGVKWWDKLERYSVKALVIGTGTITSNEKHINFTNTNPPYLTRKAMEYLTQNLDIFHLLVDLPSVDRENDANVVAHKQFFGLLDVESKDGKVCKERTITELCCIDNSKVKEGIYKLNLQLIPFPSDASPSRPLLLPFFDL